MYPRLVIDLNKLRENLDWLTAECHRIGIQVFVVTKVFCADPEICAVIEASDADGFADSRVQNLQTIETSKPKQLLRIAMGCEAEEIVRSSDISMQSSVETIRLLGEAAGKLERKHRIILMIDMGDLREGIFFKNEAGIREAAEAIIGEEWLEFAGVGVNLTCYGGIIPDETNVGGLVGFAERLRREYSLPLPIVSGGNSSMMTMLKEHRIPEGVTQLRLGESFVLGNNTETGEPMEELNTDCFVLEAKLVEVQDKPSKPIGTSGLNAFGERVTFEDRGPMRRGILAIGRQDVNPDGLTPLDEGVEIIGASSDHLLVNLNGCPWHRVGDVLRFIPDYGALLKLCTAERYVKREYIGKKD
ncbi:MAG: alanine/ornithine racemase family PLP-dependent enzyme [Clostridia bacterium]|nr:alanine/ornithine racemase family PLP-dependent enzyme [Clostridia bacterium]